MSNVGFVAMEEPTAIPQAVTENVDDVFVKTAQAVKDKVYVVWYDNGEDYDDNYQDIDRIFSNYDDAEKYLDDCGYIKQVETGYNGEYMEWHVPYDEEYPYNNSCYFIREFDLY